MNSLSNIIAITLIAFVIALYMYITHIQDVRKDLQRQVRQKQAEIVKEKQNTKIKSFEARQKAKKEVLKKQTKDKNETEINTSVGYHTLYF